MKRILSLIFMLLTISLTVFSDKIPREVSYKSDKLLLSLNNEMLYDNQLYTGRIIINDISYMDLKNGHLDGKTFIKSDRGEVTLNVVNGKLDGDFIIKGLLFEKNTDNILLNFKNGEIKTYIASIDSMSCDLTFDSNGNANGELKDYGTNEKTYLKEGIGKLKDGYVKIFLGNEKNEIIYNKFDKNGKLIIESGKGSYFKTDYVEIIWFYQIFDNFSLLGEFSDD